MKPLMAIALILPFSSLYAQQPEDTVRAALAEQTRAWNRADLPAFAATYAPHCTLLGTSIADVSRTEVLAHYREKYPTPARMGHLTFSDLKIIPLDERHAVAIARWHLDRNASSGGPAGGVFSLVLERQQDEWLIIVDHTS